MNKVTTKRIFISHATQDKPLADWLKEKIDAIFAHGVEIFVATIPSGNDWFEEILKYTQSCDIFIVLWTPSANRYWVGFETASAWNRNERPKFYPLAIGVSIKDMPEPLTRFQTRLLNKQSDIKLFFNELCDFVGFGDRAKIQPKKLLNLINEIYNSVYPPVLSPSDIRQYQDNLKEFIETLIYDRKIDATDITLLSEYALLMPNQLVELREFALNIISKKS